MTMRIVFTRLRRLAVGITACAALSACSLMDANLADAAADLYMKAESKELRVIRAASILGTAATVQGNRRNQGPNDTVTLYAQIVSAYQSLGSAYAYARSADCMTANLCVPDVSYGPRFDSAMTNAARPIILVSLHTLPANDGARLIRLVNADNPLAALNAAWVLVRDAMEAGQWVAAGYRDAVDLQAAILSSPDDRGQPPAPDVVAALKQIYSPHGSDIHATRKLIQSLYDNGDNQQHLRTEQPSPNWLKGEFAYLRQICVGQNWSAVINDTKSPLSIAPKSGGDICDYPQTAFNEAYKSTMISLGLPSTAFGPDNIYWAHRQ